MAQGRRLTGTVKWFSGQKGFGFITPDDSGEDLFVHQTSIRSDGFRILSEGESVEFSVERGGDGRTKAVDVTGTEGSAISYAGGGGGGRGFSGGRGRGGRRGGRMGGGACYNCGRSGHVARDCYQGGGGGRSGGGGGGGGGGGRYGGGGGGGGGCYNCGEYGHLARECPH